MPHLFYDLIYYQFYTGEVVGLKSSIFAYIVAQTSPEVKAIISAADYII
jgi:hypothetical protein